MDVIKYQFEVKKGMCRIIDQCDAKIEWAREKICHSCFPHFQESIVHYLTIFSISTV